MIPSSPPCPLPLPHHPQPLFLDFSLLLRSTLWQILISGVKEDILASNESLISSLTYKLSACHFHS